MNSPALAAEIARVRSAGLIGAKNKSIGAILLDAGLIKDGDIERILDHASRNGVRFGDAAVSLGLVKVGDLHGALAFQFDYPVLPTGGSEVSREVLAAYEARHPFLDEIRSLRNQIMLRWILDERRVNRVFAVISRDRGDGRTFLSANLAVTFAQMGLRTLLVDTDMRHPRLHHLFGLENKLGLSALLSQRGVTNVAHEVQGLKGLRVITAGGEPPNPQDLLSRSSFDEMLSALSEDSDVVVLDTGAAKTSAETEMLAVRARGCILLGRRNRTSIRGLADLGHRIQSIGGEIIGSVLVRA